MLRVILTIIQVFASVAIIGLVLLQRGKGAEAGAGFGSGASGTVFGARGASTALSRATAIFAAIFMVNSLLLTYVGTRVVAAPPKSILDTIGDRTSDASKQGAQTPAAPAAGITVPAAPGETAPTPPPATAGSDGTGSTTPAPAPVPPEAAPAPPASAPTQPAPK